METKALLSDYTDEEKGAYLGAIASLATADHVASEEELINISELADRAGISDDQKQLVLQAATELSGEELDRCIEILKNSELRFSLITDLISFAKADENYDDEEKSKIEEMSQQLGINKSQFSLLDHFVTKSNETNQLSNTPPKQGFLESLGLGDKFKTEGINMSGLGKGLLAIAAPLLLGKLFMSRGNRAGGMGVSGSGGMGSGGLGSIISALSMGRGFGNTGGMLSRLLQGRRF
ncbi:MAG: TerB family tellurite resistance protein [Bacteroidia bacterium]